MIGLKNPIAIRWFSLEECRAHIESGTDFRLMVDNRSLEIPVDAMSLVSQMLAKSNCEGSAT